MRARRLLAATAAALLVALPACGISTDESPRILGADTPSTAGAPTTALATGANTAAIYLGRGEANDLLVSVPRGLEGSPNPERVLEALLAGPTEDDLEDGYSTFIPAESELLDQTLSSDGTLTIDLNEPFYTRQSDAAVSAFAQVVLTVTDLSSFRIEEIRFLREGDAIQVFDGSGGTQDVVTRADYASRDPERN